MNLPFAPEEALPETARLGIADVARDTGVQKDTLRVWERRYGFPVPLRDARGDRLYDSAQLRRLLLIKRLLDAGHRPAQVVPLPEAALLRLLPAPPPLPPAPVPAAAPDPDWLALVAAGQPAALRTALHRHLLGHGLADTITGLLAPLGHQVGEAWRNGSLSVFHEHLYSEVVQTLLREALATLDGAGAEPVRAPRVLLTTLPGEQHALGLLMAECFLALARCERVALGPSTPLADLLAAVAHTGADVVALSASSHAPPREVLDHLRRLRDSLPPRVAVWLGGAFVAQRTRRLPPGVQAVADARAITARVADWRAAPAQQLR